jgi:hypothetical protein
MELLTKTMDWAEEASALARVMGDWSSSAIMITQGAQREFTQDDICCKYQYLRAASGLYSWRLLQSNRCNKPEDRGSYRHCSREGEARVGGSICPTKTYLGMRKLFRCQLIPIKQ